MANPTPKPSDLAGMLREIHAVFDRRIRELATFDATQYSRAIEKLTALVDALPAQIDAALAIEVNTGNVNASGHGHFGADVTAASVAATGSVSGANVYGGNVFAASAGNMAGNITTGRTTGWIRTSDGFVGNTLSSLRFKADVIEADIDPLAVLGISVKHYRYIAELRKRDDPTFEGYVGPHYHVAQEVGMIAEELHAAGLWQYVIYERDMITIDAAEDDRDQSEEMFERVTLERLRLDANGEPIPQSIHYELWSMAVQVATKHVWDEHLKVRADTDMILTHLGLAVGA